MISKKVTVCMATFNGELYIKEQLTSILSQLSQNDEVIISDDGSSDATIEIVRSFKDQRIQLYQNQFKDVIKNFEFTLTKANGDIIFLSDQDDIWFENKVANYLELLEGNDLIFSNLSVFKDNVQKGSPMFNSKKNHNGFMGNFIKNHCVGATMAFKADMLKYVLPFPNHIEMHDMWIYFISSIYGKTHYIQTPTIHYRRHGENLSNTGNRTTNSVFKIIGIRLTWIKTIAQRVVKISLKSSKGQHIV